MNNSINKSITVTSLYFAGADMKAFPRRVEYEGKSYTFRDGVACLIEKGSRTCSVFTMSDGARRYRLRCSQAGDWTLLGIGN